MKLKKLNAVLALLSTICLLAHMGYSAFTYATMYYNPVLTKVFSIPCMVFICLHAVLGMSIVFVQQDGTRLDLYPKQNRETLLQRISAALIFPLLIMHINTFSYIMQNVQAGKPGVVVLLIIVNVLFYGIVLTHVAVSFSKALITLGWLSSREKKKTIDIVVYILCAVIFVVLLLTIVRGQVKMFLQ